MSFLTIDRLLRNAAPVPDGGELSDLPTSFGCVVPPPPYDPGPRKKLPAWARHLRDLRPLKLVR